MAVTVIARPVIIARPVATPHVPVHVAEPTPVRAVPHVEEVTPTHVPVIVMPSTQISASSEDSGETHDYIAHNPEASNINHGPFILGIFFFCLALSIGLLAMVSAKNPKAYRVTYLAGGFAGGFAVIAVICSVFAFNWG